MVDIDQKDVIIINELIDDTKKPLREIAKKLKISFVTVMNRIRKLEKKKIIKSYSAIIDYEKLNYDIHVMIELRISKGKSLELENKIANNNNIYALYDITGDYDAILLARFTTRKSMDSFLKKIQTYEFIERTNTRLILNTIKEKQIIL